MLNEATTIFKTKSTVKCFSGYYMSEDSWNSFRGFL